MKIRLIIDKYMQSFRGLSQFRQGKASHLCLLHHLQNTHSNYVPQLYNINPVVKKNSSIKPKACFQLH